MIEASAAVIYLALIGVLYWYHRIRVDEARRMRREADALLSHAEGLRENARRAVQDDPKIRKAETVKPEAAG